MRRATGRLPNERGRVGRCDGLGETPMDEDRSFAADRHDAFERERLGLLRDVTDPMTSVSETPVRRPEETGRGDPIGPLDWLKIVPFKAVAASHRLGWVGLEAVRYHAAPPFELNPPAITHHR